MSNYRIDDLCSVELSVVKVSGGQIQLRHSPKDLIWINHDHPGLTLLRRAPVELASGELGDGIPVRKREDPECTGVMLNRVKQGKLIFAFVDWDNSQPGVCLVSEIEQFHPDRIPAPEQKTIDSLRSLNGDLVQAVEYAASGLLDHLKTFHNTEVPSQEARSLHSIRARLVSSVQDDNRNRFGLSPTDICPPDYFMVKGDKSLLSDTIEILRLMILNWNDRHPEDPDEILTDLKARFENVHVAHAETLVKRDTA